MITPPMRAGAEQSGCAMVAHKAALMGFQGLGIEVRMMKMCSTRECDYRRIKPQANEADRGGIPNALISRVLAWIQT